MRLTLTNPDPSQFQMSIYRVYLCQGVPGYIPQYKPEAREYGCLIDSALIQQRNKLYVSSIYLVRMIAFLFGDSLRSCIIFLILFSKQKDVFSFLFLIYF